MNNLKLSIVIPTFNEEQGINELLSEVKESFHDLTNFEIVLIDDGSEKPLIQNIKKELISDELKVIRNNFNIGQTPSIKLGIENSKGEIIALMDGDGQNPPSEVRKLYDIFCSKDLDAVVSYREKRKDNLYKKIISKSGNFVLRFFTKSKFKDLGSSIKIIKKDALKTIKLDGELHRFIVPMLEKRNYRIEEHGTKHEYRKTGKSNYGLNRLIPVFVDGLLFYLSDGFTKTKRYAIGKIAFFTLFLGIIINSFVVYQKITNDIYVHRNPLFIIGITSILMSIFIFSIGISIDKNDN
jgi:glycosyltransferase involved in cell wall biosynthesis